MTTFDQPENKRIN